MLDRLRQPKIQGMLWLLMAVAFAAVFAVYLYRSLGRGEGTDFPEFYQAGRHILEHGARQPDSLLHRYLPSVDVAWVLIAWMPMPVSAVVWYLLSVGTWVGLLRCVDTHLLKPMGSDHRSLALLATAGLTLVYALDHVLLGAFHLVMLWLMIAGVARALRGQGIGGGVLLGLGVWLKLLPLLGVGYLVLKRRWRAAGLAVIVALTVDVALTVGGLGWQSGWDAHVRWWHERGVGDLNAVLQGEGFMAQLRDRNQAVPAVLRRVLTQPPPDHPEPMYEQIAIADLSGGALTAVFLVYAGLLLGVLGWYGRRPAWSLLPGRGAEELAMLALATMWFSPIVFSYHPVAMMPAVAVLIGRERVGSRRGWVTVIAALAGMVLLAFPVTRALGEIQWVAWILAVLLATGRARQFHAG